MQVFGIFQGRLHSAWNGEPNSLREAVKVLLRRCVAFVALLVYLLFAEHLLRDSRLVHVLLIPFGNVWVGAAVFSFCFLSAERQFAGVESGGMTRAWRRTLAVLIVAWVAYMALGVFMYLTGGI